MTVQIKPLSLDDARRVISAEEEKAREIGQPMNVAVVDAGGNLASRIRMDGTFDISTKDFAENSQL